MSWEVCQGGPPEDGWFHLYCMFDMDPGERELHVVGERVMGFLLDIEEAAEDLRE